MSEAESIFVDGALEVLSWSSSISFEIGDMEAVVLAVMSAVTLGNDEKSAGFTWASEMAARIPIGTAKDASKDALEKAVSGWRGEQQPGDYNPEPTWEIIRKLALARNVDISDESSVFVRRLRIAAKDADPSRLLRFCEELIVTWGSVSRVDRSIVQLIGMDTSSNKVVHCRKFDLHLESTDADSAFARFTTQHCDSCASRTPRPEDWAYRGEARKQLDEANLRFVKAASAEGKGFRLTDKDDLE